MVKEETIQKLATIQLDPNDKPNIAYAKARFAIEEICKNREEIRTAKNIMIEHLKGSIKHPDERAKARGATKFVLFPGGARAKY